MYRLTLVSLLTLSLTSFAQVNEGKLDTTLGVQLVSDYCYQFLELNDGNYLVAGLHTQPEQGASIFDTSGNYVDGFIGLDIRIGGVESPITKVLQQADGKLLFFNTIKAPRVHRYSNTTLTKDSSFAPVAGCPENQGDIFDAELQADQRIIIGGSFSYYDQIGNARLARINTDGTADMSFNSNTKILGNEILEVEIQSDGKILIGGDFTAEDLSSNTEYKHLVRLLADGSVDTSFHYFTNQIIRAMDLQDDGKLIVARQEGTELYGRMTISRLNSDGSLDSTFQESRTIKKLGNSFTFVYVHDIHVQADGRVYLAGSFDELRFGGTQLNDSIKRFRNLTRLHANGNVDYDFYPNVDTNYYVSGRVYEVNTVQNGDILIGGVFVKVGGVDAHYTARLRSNSGAFVGIKSVPYPRHAMHVYPNPSGSSFTVEWPKGIATATVYDLNGRRVATLNTQLSNGQFHPERPGVYILKGTFVDGSVSYAKLLRNE